MKDTWDTRMAKLRLSADSFVRQQEAHAKVSCDGMWAKLRQLCWEGGIRLPCVGW